MDQFLFLHVTTTCSHSSTNPYLHLHAFIPHRVSLCMDLRHDDVSLFGTKINYIDTYAVRAVTQATHNFATSATDS
jgi:hypothetical protein